MESIYDGTYTPYGRYLEQKATFDEQQFSLKRGEDGGESLKLRLPLFAVAQTSRLKRFSCFLGLHKPYFYLNNTQKKWLADRCDEAPAPVRIFGTPKVITRQCAPSTLRSALGNHVQGQRQAHE